MDPRSSRSRELRDPSIFKATLKPAATTIEKMALVLRGIYDHPTVQKKLKEARDGK